MNDADRDIDAFARRILLGSTLQGKLAPHDAPVAVPAGTAAPHADSGPAAAGFTVPAFPGRPPELLHIGNSKFPSTRHLHDPTARAHVLHFFANHELLAMELMALVLLKFPDAPPAFRTGLVRTIEEEQTHLRLYLERMQELGVQFGALPLTDYFWNNLKDVQSPLEFVVQMSLTFEQANLDYSLYYRDEVARHGDERTAAILDRVYREEIGHVKHGLVWFNRWRDNAANENDWDAYRRLLPPPLSPRRAKGVGFCAEARREAGLSETFIHELEIHAGSKGRPPVVWVYNPSCDAEIVRGTPGFRAPHAAQQLSGDLAPLLMMLARDADMVRVRQRPRREWLKDMAACGFQIPEFVEGLDLREPKFSGLEPWGWSPEVLEMFRPLRDRLVARKDGRSLWHRALLEHADFAATRLGPFFSKAWAAEFLRRWLRDHPETQALFGTAEEVGTVATSEPEVEAGLQALWSAGGRAVLKAPWGTAGNQIQRAASAADVTEPLRGWIRNRLVDQGAMIVEPWLAKSRDFSMQMEVRAQGDAKLYGAREFWTDDRWQYQGTVLGRGFWRLPADELRFLNQALPVWRRLVRDVGRALAAGGYQGPAGIDAMLWRTPAGSMRFKPLGELNPRWTMGRVALELENHVVPGRAAVWRFVRAGAVDPAGLKQRHPARFVDAENGRRLASGVFFTTDPETAVAVHTVLAVGDEAVTAALAGFPPLRV